jgi:hypothetical protein
VSVNQKTVIDSSIPGQSILALKPDVDLVEVSGFVTGDGRILATFIMLKTTGTPHYEVQGEIKNHDAIGRVFEIGDLVVDYASADLGNLPSPTGNWNGIVVYARGDQWKRGGPGAYGARLTATRLIRPVLGVEDSDDAKVEGFILRTDAPGDFFVNNLHVQTTAATDFEGGGLTDLIVGAHVEVHGELVNGVLQAEDISFEGDVELESNVVSLDAASQTVTLADLSSLLVSADGRTHIDGEGDLRRLADLQIGDHIKVHGRLAGGNRLMATELERSDPSTALKLQAPLQSWRDPFLVLAGITIDTSGIPNSGFIGPYGTIGRSAFFQSLTTGLTVSVKGTIGGTSVTWTSARLDD